LLHLKSPYLLLKSLLQHRGKVKIKIKENAEKMFYFFLKKSNDNKLNINYSTNSPPFFAPNSTLYRSSLIVNDATEFLMRCLNSSALLGRFSLYIFTHA
jgi:hypothetical protein